MKKRVVGIFFALVLCLAMVPISAFAEQKTTIRTVDQLLQFAKAVDNGEYDDKTDAVVSLEADLDLKDVKTWTPIGSADNDANVPHFFSGKFYGNGHTISNLDFSDAYGMIEYESYGFFGYIENAEISGLTVQGSVNATGSRKYSDFGSIVGASIKSTIRDCVSDISFTNSDNYLYGSIGLCGFAMDSTFEHCQSKGSISVTRTDNDGASLNVGGIVGYAGGTSEIRYCFNTADIEVRANSIGGIAGSLGSGNPSITNCYSIGKLTVLGKPSIPNFIFSHNSFIFKGFPSFAGSLRTISAPFCPSSAGFPFCLENPDSAQHEVLGDVHIAIHGGFNTRVTKQFLKRLWRHAIFDSAGCISMPQGVHTEALYPRLITKLIEVGVIGTVFCRLSCSPVHKD